MKKKLMVILILIASIWTFFSPGVLALRYIPTPQQLQPLPDNSQPNFSGNVNFQPQNRGNSLTVGSSTGAVTGSQSSADKPQAGVPAAAEGQKSSSVWQWAAGFLAAALVLFLFWWITRKSDEQ